MKCPVCISESLVMSERSGIEIDFCPKCRGVWLDRGELDKIIERSEKQTSIRPLYNEERAVPHYDNHDRKEYSQHHKPHKKESFWGELFD
ncbi:zf-TFIIB domain-containing protein [Sulfuricurvum sp.]|uniref:TFIIB-type zinc ribbon-containing protein n=1 Tax=Sulfuricurvum sp. TaxID=2025608 RepID=UPI0025CD75D3|nr:zf-TFIIB domain-containing protein [Sulfuricurvum sp.]